MIEDYITGDDDFKNCSTENDLHALKESVKTGIKDAYPMLHPEEIEEIFGNVDDASLLEKIDEMNDRADNSSYYPRGDGIQQSHWSVVHEVDRIFSGLS